MRLPAAGLACLACYAVISRLGDLDHDRARLAVAVAAAWLVFGLAARWALRPEPVVGQRRLLTVVLLAAACQLPGVLVAPQSSSDAYRYVWDGRVQLSGTSPYRYVPLDDHLARLRDPVLFPGLSPRQPSGVATLPELPTDRADLRALAGNDPRTRINRPRVPTIYPPVAQAWFAAVAALTPWSAGTTGVQAGAALIAVALTAALGGLLRRRGRDPALALLWGWCPLVVLEAGNGAHVDVLATGLIVASLAALGSWTAALTSARTWPSRLVGGALLGLAAGTKILPLLLLPALTALRRRSGVEAGQAQQPAPVVAGGARELAVPVAAVGSFALTYLPHLLAAGALVIGYLPGYLTEEGFDTGGRYAVLGLVLPPPARQPVALLLGLALAGLALYRADPARPERTAVWLFGGALLIATPAYPWYSLPLVALAVLAGRPQWLAVPVAGYAAYAGFRIPYLPGLAYALAAVVVLTLSSTSARMDQET